MTQKHLCAKIILVEDACTKRRPPSPPKHTAGRKGPRWKLPTPPEALGGVAMWDLPLCPWPEAAQAPPAGDRARGEESALTCSFVSSQLAKIQSFIAVTMANSLRP